MSKPQILIVEDEGIVATDLQRRVTRMGYDAPQIMSSAEEAVTEAERSHPNLVLMDIHLKGDLDGVEAAERIRSSLGIPVVFLTAFSDENTLRRARASEPYGYLLKPFGETELRMTIDIALQHHAFAKRLKEEQIRATSTLTSLADGVICIDARGNIISMNPAAESLTGWSQADAEHCHIGEVLPVQDEMISQLTSEVVAGALYPLALRRPHNGTQVPIEAHIATLITMDGKIDGAVIAIREVKTPFSRAAEVDAEDRARILVQAFPDAIFRLDRSGTVLDAHLPGADIADGVSPLGSNLYSSSLPTLVVDQILTAVRWALEKCESRTLEFSLPTPNGARRQCAHIVPSARDEAVMVLRDITGFHSETLRQTATLDMADKEIATISESLEEALRNPLLTAHELCNHVTTNFTSHLPVEGRACIRLIQETSAAMRESMDDVLFFLSLRTQPIEKTQVSMRALTREICHQVSRRYASRQIHVSVSQLPDCFASEPLVQRLLNALIDNAFKFTRQRRKAQIQIGSQRLPDGISYYVRDNGIGFDERYANQIFGPFHRLHRGEDYLGLGLGLAIAQRIVERHGGQIWAESNAANGTVFSFTLPYH